MKIAHIVCRYPPYYSGMSTAVFETASNLTKRGHEVVVFTPDFYEEKEIKSSDEPVELEHAPELQKQIDFARRLEPSVTYGNAARLSGLGKELNNFDLVHLHYPFFGTAGLVRKWKLKNSTKPLVITYHMDTRAPGWRGLIFKLYARHFMPKILGIADTVIASSFDYAAASDAKAIFAANKAKWVELPFGVDTNRFFPVPRDQSFAIAQGLNPGLPTVLFVGGMDEAHFFKGIPVLLEALRIAKNSGKLIQALLVGDGDKREDYELKAKNLGIGDLVVFAGRVSDEELPSYYQNADLFVLPSITVGEAFGMVLLEAYASGVPVVASDLPGVRTVAARAGTIVRPNDPMALSETLIDYFNPAVDQVAWQQSARTVAETEFAWPLIVEKLEAIYKKLF